MRIRISIKDYDSLRTEIRRRSHRGEWNTWETIEVGTKTKVERLVHVPKDDDQYKDIQLKLVNPTADDIKANILYLDIIPIVVVGSKLTESQRKEKKAIVLGRFSEILNRYFPKIMGYRVILKEK